MSDQIRNASPGYATGQLALRMLRRWEDVVSGMADGTLTIGSRTPVADTPAWVTLDVAHGGFATGRYLAEVPLSEDETARVAALPDDVPGGNERERLNLWYLGDAGQAELLDAVRSGHYRVEVPEDAALPVVALLLDKGFPEQALDLVAELRPLMHQLRSRCGAAPSRVSCRTSTRTGPCAAAGRAGRGPLTGRRPGLRGSQTSRRRVAGTRPRAGRPTRRTTSRDCAAHWSPARTAARRSPRGRSAGSAGPSRTR